MTPPSGQALHDCDTVCRLFDALFGASDNTLLVSGGNEPLYLPADSHHEFNRIVFRHDYVSSALHEVAHWCIAGRERRKLPDYGYWYQPDGRDASQQNDFERVEAAPQALEWIFNNACGLRFRPSIDNLGGVPTDSTRFRNAIVREARRFCASGLSPRAARFHAGLTGHCGRCAALRSADYFAAHLR